MKSIFLIAAFALPAYGAEPPEASRDAPNAPDSIATGAAFARLAGISGESPLPPTLNTLSRPTAKNWKYTMQLIGASGDVAPSLAFDDGRFTYFQFEANREIPAVFAVSPQGEESRVNYHIDAVDTSLVAVERMGPCFMLRLGNSTVVVWNEAFDTEGVPPTDGTTRFALPGGRARVPVNPQGAIDDYLAAAARETPTEVEEAQQRHADALQRDLAELKALLAELSLPQEALPAPAKNLSQLGAATKMPAPGEAMASTAKYLPSETITLRDRSILFTVTLGSGDTQFAPGSAFQKALLVAAKNAASIAILGATDATKASAESARTAKGSAENARKYLSDNGIELGKMTTTYLAARGFVANNATSEKKGRNRRVEIEMEMETSRKPDTAALEAKTRATL